MGSAYNSPDVKAVDVLGLKVFTLAFKTRTHEIISMSCHAPLLLLSLSFLWTGSYLTSHPSCCSNSLRPVLMYCSHKIISLLLRDCSSAALMNCNVIYLFSDGLR